MRCSLETMVQFMEAAMSAIATIIRLVAITILEFLDGFDTLDLRKFFQRAVESKKN